MPRQSFLFVKMASWKYTLSRLHPEKLFPGGIFDPEFYLRKICSLSDSQHTNSQAIFQFLRLSLVGVVSTLNSCGRAESEYCLKRPQMFLNAKTSAQDF